MQQADVDASPTKRPLWPPFLGRRSAFLRAKKGGKSAGTSSSSSFFGSIFVSALVSSRYLVDIIYIYVFDLYNMMYCSRCIDLFLWFWGFPVSASPGVVLLVVAQSIFSEGLLSFVSAWEPRLGKVGSPVCVFGPLWVWEVYGILWWKSMIMESVWEYPYKYK